MSNREGASGDLLPIVDLLRDCKTDLDRAKWLFAVPFAIVVRDHTAIREILQNAGFEAGVKCLDAELAMLNCRRLDDGSLPFFASYTLHLARTDMAIALRKAGAAAASRNSTVHRTE